MNVCKYGYCSHFRRWCMIFIIISYIKKQVCKNVIFLHFFFFLTEPGVCKSSSLSIRQLSNLIFFPEISSIFLDDLKSKLKWLEEPALRSGPGVHRDLPGFISSLIWAQSGDCWVFPPHSRPLFTSLAFLLSLPLAFCMPHVSSSSKPWKPLKTNYGNKLECTSQT